MIHLWDTMGNYLLSSRNDPLNIELGETGMTPTVNDTSLNAKFYLGKSSYNNSPKIKL